MKLKVVPNHDGDWNIREEISAQSLELPEDPCFSQIIVDIDVRQQDRRIDLDIVVDAVVKTDCWHCGEPYQFTLSPQHHLRVLRVADPDRDRKEDDIQFIGLADTTVDITQDLRDLLRLELPMRIVCCGDPADDPQAPGS